MSRLLIYAIVFIEGFCSLGAEVIALTLSLQIKQYGVTNDTCLR